MNFVILTNILRNMVNRPENISIGLLGVVGFAEYQ